MGQVKSIKSHSSQCNLQLIQKEIEWQASGVDSFEKSSGTFKRLRKQLCVELNDS